MRIPVLVVGLLVSTVAAAQQTTPPPPATAPSAATITIEREVFTYSDRGRRDPMVSLMKSLDIRPLLQDIELVGIIFDPAGGNSQATFKDLVDTKKIYRVRTGQTLGRMMVSEITARDVEFTIEEFGFSRRERLLLKPDTTAKRTP